MQPVKNSEPITPSASLGARIGSLVYDAIAVIAIVFFACFIPVLFSGDVIEPGNALFLIYILAIIFFYFAVCWQKGKTLGMQVWKLEIKKFNGGSLTKADSLFRFAAAAISLGTMGIGYAPALWRADKLTWQDILSKTYIRKI
jgi:uncharacterized RDD family membrane protein YckC